jgi:hypothetical protein
MTGPKHQSSIGILVYESQCLTKSALDVKKFLLQNLPLNLSCGRVEEDVR